MIIKFLLESFGEILTIKWLKISFISKYVIKTYVKNYFFIYNFLKI